MKREDIEHVATLSRIALHDGEAEKMAQEIGEILSYVSAIEKITGSVAAEKKVGAVNNVMREDVNPRPADTYTEALLSAAPERKGRYVVVKKILADN